MTKYQPSDDGRVIGGKMVLFLRGAPRRRDPRDIHGTDRDDGSDRLGEPHWVLGAGGTDLVHGEEIDVSVQGRRLEGRMVRFIVEKQEGESWHAFADASALINRSTASATIQLHHPVAPRTRQHGDHLGHDELTLARPVTLRVRAQLLPGRGATPGTLGDPHWMLEGGPEVGHGVEIRVQVPAPSLDGRRVRFLIEQQQDGDWHPFADAQAQVSGGAASAQVQLHHPVAPQSRPQGQHLKHDEMQSAQPLTLRVRAQLA